MTLFRIPPLMEANAYKTYELRAPRSTHFRKTTCAEVDCPAYANGWNTTIDVNTPLGAQQANYIRLHSGRVFTHEWRDKNMVSFTFSPGQQCFAEHRVPLEREPTYVVRPGDWRMPQAGGRTLRAADWVDDFATHQEKLKTQVERG
jgi:hypothetical protein